MGFAIGTIIGSLISAYGQWRTNRESRDFAQSQSETQYQRAVKDMQAAGLNPMLAYQQGGNATAGWNPQNPVGGLAQAVSSAIAAKNDTAQTKAMVDTKASETALNEQLRRKAEMDTQRAAVGLNQDKFEYNKNVMTLPKQIEQIIANVSNTNADSSAKQAAARLAEVNARLGTANATNAEWEAGRTKVMNEFGDLFGKGKEWLKYVPSALQSMFGTSAAGAAALIKATGL